MQSPQNFLETFVILDDKITKKELAICRSFLWFFKERLVGNHQETFPAIKKIAEMSKCSTRTVNTFIEKYEGIIISHKSKRNFETGKHHSNRYEFNREFFENMILLDACGYLKKWTKKTKIHVLKSYLKNEWFLHEILLCRGDLMNNKIAHGFYQKLRTIENFFLSRRFLNKALQGASHKKRPEKGFGVKDPGFVHLQGLPLSDQQKRNLVAQFGPYHLKRGREAFLFKNGDSDSIKNPGSFIFMSCRQSILQTMARK
jgi:hypothetical protein